MPLPVAARGHRHDPAKAASGGWQRASVAAIALVAAGFIVASTCYWAWQSAHPLPYWDAWHFVDDFAHACDGTYSLRELLRPANEHRIALPRLFLFADYFWFAGGEKALVVAGLLMLAALALLVARLAVTRTDWPPATRLATTAFVVATLFSGTRSSTHENTPWQMM